MSKICKLLIASIMVGSAWGQATPSGGNAPAPSGSKSAPASSEQAPAQAQAQAPEAPLGLTSSFPDWIVAPNVKTVVSDPKLLSQAAPAGLPEGLIDPNKVPVVTAADLHPLTRRGKTPAKMPAAAANTEVAANTATVNSTRTEWMLALAKPAPLQTAAVAQSLASEAADMQENQPVAASSSPLPAAPQPEIAPEVASTPAPQPAPSIAAAPPAPVKPPISEKPVIVAAARSSASRTRVQTGTGMPNEPPVFEAPATSPPSFGFSELNCSGFATPGKFPTRSRVAGSETGSMVSELVEGDVVYLTKAQAYPAGTQLRVMREIRDPNLSEQFPGQRHWLSSIGRLYQPMGRVEVLRVEKGMAIGRVMFACEPVRVGDFVIPWKPLNGPSLQEKEVVNITQPVASRSALIVASKDFESEMGVGDEIYLSWGSDHRLHQGQKMVIFRRSSSPSSRFYGAANAGMSQLGYHQAGVDVNSLMNQAKPPIVLGEATVLWVEPNSATAVINFSHEPIFPGDEVAVPLSQ